MKKATRKSATTGTGPMSSYGSMATPASASRSSAAPVKKVLERISVEVAKNGFTVSASHRGSKGEYLNDSAPSKPMVFQDAEQMLKHVASLVGHPLEEEDEPETPRSRAGSQMRSSSSKSSGKSAKAA